MKSKPLILLITLCISFLALSAEATQEDLNRQLREVALIGDTDQIKVLLEKGADVDAANQFGKTALMLAVEEGNTASVEIL